MENKLKIATTIPAPNRELWTIKRTRRFWLMQLKQINLKLSQPK